MKLISVVSSCYNEEENVEPLYEAVKAIFAQRPEYRYEHILIDNASKDRTAERLRWLAARDPNVKVILNTRNFGHIRSPYHAIMQARANAVLDFRQARTDLDHQRAEAGTALLDELSQPLAFAQAHRAEFVEGLLEQRAAGT